MAGIVPLNQGWWMVSESNVKMQVGVGGIGEAEKLLRVIRFPLPSP